MLALYYYTILFRVVMHTKHTYCIYSIYLYIIWFYLLRLGAQKVDLVSPDHYSVYTALSHILSAFMVFSSGMWLWSNTEGLIYIMFTSGCP